MNYRKIILSFVAFLILLAVGILLSGQFKGHPISNAKPTEKECTEFQSLTDDVMNTQREKGDCAMLSAGLQHCKEKCPECQYCEHIQIASNLLNCSTK